MPMKNATHSRLVMVFLRIAIPRFCNNERDANRHRDHRQRREPSI
jgi:hypothetical protein